MTNLIRFFTFNILQTLIRWREEWSLVLFSQENKYSYRLLSVYFFAKRKIKRLADDKYLVIIFSVFSFVFSLFSHYMVVISYCI